MDEKTPAVIYPPMNEDERRSHIQVIQKGSYIRGITLNGESYSLSPQERKFSAEKCSPVLMSELEDIAENSRNLGILKRFNLSRTRRTLSLQLSYGSFLGIGGVQPKIIYCRTEKAGKALERMTEGNMALFFSVAKMYLGRGIDFPELVNEAYLGFMRAVDKFDLERRNKKGKLLRFSTYACQSMINAVKRAIRYEKKRQAPRSLNEHFEHGVELGDVVEDTQRANCSDSPEVAELEDIAEEMLWELAPEHRAIIALNKDRTIKDIAMLFGASAHNIKQMRKLAMKNLADMGEELEIDIPVKQH